VSNVSFFVGRDGYGLPYVLVQFSYDRQVVDLIKELHYTDREWCPEPKLWKVKSPLAADLLLTALQRCGHHVTVYDPTEIIWRKSHRDRPRKTPGTPNWADAMFKALPPELHDKAYIALMKVLHPDRAGDAGTEPMKDLNAARDKARELEK
jgi:hypothetical protein